MASVKLLRWSRISKEPLPILAGLAYVLIGSSLFTTAYTTLPDPSAAASIVLLIGIHAGLGLAAGRWAAIGLVTVPWLFALATGFDDWGVLLTAFYGSMAIPIAAAVVALGVFARIKSDALTARTGRPPYARIAGALLVAASFGIFGVGAFAEVRHETSAGKVAGAEISIGNESSDLAVGEGAVWVLSREARTLTKLDPRTDHVVGTLRLPRLDGGVVPTRSEPTGLAVGEGGVWIANSGGLVIRVDPRSVSVVDKRIPVPGLSDLAIAYGALWALFENGMERIPLESGAGYVQKRRYYLQRIDPATNRLMGSPLRARGEDPRVFEAGDIESGEGALWLVSERNVRRVDVQRAGAPTLGASLAGGKLNGGVAVGAGAVWTASDCAVERSDIPSHQVFQRDLGSCTAEEPNHVGEVAVGNGTAWVVYRRSIVRLDPRTAEVIGRLRLGPPFFRNHLLGDLAVGYGSVWVVDRTDRTVREVRPG